MSSGFDVKKEETATLHEWIAGLGHISEAPHVGVYISRQGWGQLGLGQSILFEPLCLAGKQYEWGLGSHADSEIVLHCNKPLKTFRAFAGVDYNVNSVDGKAEVVFSVHANGKKLAESAPLNVKSEPAYIEAQLDGVTEFTLKADKFNSLSFPHADWANAEVVTVDGETLKCGTPETQYVANMLPVSFTYNNMSSEAWFRKFGITRSQSDAKDATTHKFICSDTETGLEFTLEILEYKKLPACVWRVFFKNIGTRVTPILKDVKTLDLAWVAEGQKHLFRANGSFEYDNEGHSSEIYRDNFKLFKEDLFRTHEINMGGVGGRPSVDWMPYFNFAGKDEGLIFGVGWTGQWQAKIKSGDHCVSFQSGMENIHTVLRPGEQISQPSTLMIYWRGDDYLRGHNLLRRFINDELLPKHNGKPLQAPVCCGTWGGMKASEHVKRIANIEEYKLPYDFYWIDAGWYGDAGPNPDEFSQIWASQAGNWKINSETYPDGFKDISNRIHESGKKFLLWFEPERAICGTPVTQEHPDWFLGVRKEGANLLLDMGNPQAWKWCLELVSGMIAKDGIDCYRQDFNISPLQYWRENDSPDRMGMTEIRHVEGLYAFLDALLLRFPNLLIDNCASGGRRLDFEMMRRSIPLWASDMQCSPNYVTERNLQLVQGLSMWIPQFAFATQTRPGNTYNFRSAMAAGIVAHLFPYEKCAITPDYPYDWLRDRLNEFHRAKSCFTGDFYPLLPQRDLFIDWCAYQFHRPDSGCGIVEVFRKKDSPIEKICFELKGLHPDKDYTVEDADSKQISIIKGRQLMEKGLTVEITAKAQSRLFFYEAISGK